MTHLNLSFGTVEDVEKSQEARDSVQNLLSRLHPDFSFTFGSTLERSSDHRSGAAAPIPLAVEKVQYQPTKAPNVDIYSAPQGVSIM